MKQDAAYNCVEIASFTESVAGNPNFFKGYIDQCQADTQCANKYYGGLSQELSRLFSCHVCTLTDNIPFSSIRSPINNNTLVFEGL